MSFFKLLILASILQFVIPWILTYHILKGDECAEVWWKVNREVEPGATGGMFIFFMGLGGVIGLKGFGAPFLLWDDFRTQSLLFPLIAMFGGLVGFIYAKFFEPDDSI